MLQPIRTTKIMIKQANCGRTAQRRKLAASVLLCALGVAGALIVLAGLVAQVRSLDAVDHAPFTCSLSRDRPEWPPLRRHHAAAPGLPCAALGLARTDLESAEREVQAMRPT
jgi:hypothetical protein